jgi:hypothetical protein
MRNPDRPYTAIVEGVHGVVMATLYKVMCTDPLASDDALAADVLAWFADSGLRRAKAISRAAPATALVVVARRVLVGWSARSRFRQRLLAAHM